MRYLLLVAKIVLFLLLLSFAVQNSEPVTLHYLLGWSWQAPLSLVILLAFAAGAVLGLIGGARQSIRQRRQIRRLAGAGNKSDVAGAG